MKKILFVVNVDWFFVSHRLPIAIQAINAGYEVHVATRITSKLDLLEKLGLVVHHIPMTRNLKILDLFNFWELFWIVRGVRPDIVHTVSNKPLLCGSLAARLNNVPGLVSAVSGLGMVFSSKKVKHRILKYISRPIFYYALNHKNQIVIFQNDWDFQTLIDYVGIRRQKCRKILGSGVDLGLCQYTPEPDGTPVVSFASRLLIDKGVEVFVEAAKILEDRKIGVYFWLIGSIDEENDNSATKEQLELWGKSDMIKIFGKRSDVPGLFSKSNLVVFPSFYGEGIPKVLLEAAACGRAVITTDHPGCREAISPNKTGKLIPTKDPQALASEILYMIDNPEVRKDMGRLGRERAEKMFDIDSVVKQHLGIYNEILASQNSD